MSSRKEDKAIHSARVAKRKSDKTKVHRPPANAPAVTADGEPSNAAVTPKSMVFRRGQVGQTVLQLIHDLRLVMSPDTAVRLEERRENTMKDFLSVGPQLGVTHFLCLTQSDVGVNLRIIRVPHGPTLTFRVVKYSLMRDVAHASKRPHSPGSEMLHAPLVVLNAFNQPTDPSNSTTNHMQLMSTVLQSMFAPLHLPTLNLSACRRVVLFNYDPAINLIEMRHYLITAQPTGLSNKNIKKLVKGQLLDLGHLNDVSEFLDSRVGGAVTSDSELEGEDNKVVLPDHFAGRGNRVNQRSAIKLKEIGPRMSLLLMKAEDGFCNGQVLYHHYITKSEEQIKEMRKAKEQRKREREARRREQERRVRMKNGEDADETTSSGKHHDDSEQDEEEELNEDEQWYEQEVGERPDPSVFGRGDGKRSSESSQADRPAKKRRTDDGQDGDDDDKKKKRTGGRRVGAAPSKPWVRGRGGATSRGGRGGGGRGGRGGRSEGSSRGRGGGSSRGSSRGGRGRGRG